MIRTDAPVRTDKFDYDEDEHLAIGEFESHHVFGDWHLASTKLESAWIYALLVDSDELSELQELASDAKGRFLDYAPLADYLRELESWHIAAPSLEWPPISDPNGAVRISPFVVIRSMDRRYKQEILAVNYVNHRFVRRPGRERSLLEELAKQPLTASASTKPLRRKLETLHRFGVVVIDGGPLGSRSLSSVGALYERPFFP